MFEEKKKTAALMKKRILVFPDFRASFTSYLLRQAALRKKTSLRSKNPVPDSNRAIGELHSSLSAEWKKSATRKLPVSFAKDRD